MYLLRNPISGKHVTIMWCREIIPIFSSDKKKNTYWKCEDKKDDPVKLAVRKTNIFRVRCEITLKGKCTPNYQQIGNSLPTLQSPRNLKIVTVHMILMLKRYTYKD